jgi:hypothetical protein
MASSSSPTTPLFLQIALKVLSSEQRKLQEMERENVTARRLQAVANHTSVPSQPKEKNTLLLVLPDGGKVDAALAKDPEDPNEIILNGSVVVLYIISESQDFALDVTSVGTRYQGATTHIPKYKLLTLSAPKIPTGRAKDVSIPDFWVAIYALFTLYYTQEHIPVAFSSFLNADEIKEYLITTGLGRLYPTSELSVKKFPLTKDIIFLSRATFWQGAGTTGYHRRSWLLNLKPTTFPSVQSFTRNEKVIATHPLRPSKPQPGEVLYRRWCSAVSQMLEITYFDLEGVHDGTKALGGGLSRHMVAFHKWHNDERVNTAWGERGSLETHREYVEQLIADPHVLPCMLSWDGELMGYVEIVYVKEDHVAQHYPSDVVPGEWERGIHVLVGENKFLGGGRCKGAFFHHLSRNLTSYLPS